MLATPIILVVMLWAFSLFGLFYIENYMDKSDKKETIETNEKLKALIFSALTISIVIYLFTLHIGLGVISVIICVISLIILATYKEEHGIFIICVLLGILCTCILLGAHFIKSKKEDIKEETIYLNEYDTKSSNKVVIIKLNVTPQTFSIMEYNSKTILPFTINTSDFEANTKENKIVVITKIIKTDSLLSYFNFGKPKVKEEISYKIYLNKDNIKYN